MGELTNPKNQTLRDLNPREFSICAALTVMILWVGIYPSPFLKMMEGSIQYVTSRTQSGMVSGERDLNISLAGLTTVDRLEPTIFTPIKASAPMTMLDTLKEGPDDH